jgi:hypothetical protein
MSGHIKNFRVRKRLIGRRETTVMLDGHLTLIGHAPGHYLLRATHREDHAKKRATRRHIREGLL